jgi:hypothetical protein
LQKYKCKSPLIDRNITLVVNEYYFLPIVNSYMPRPKEAVLKGFSTV